MKIRSFFLVFLFLAATGALSPARSQWAGDGNPICTVAGDQYEISMDSDGAGGAVLVWRDERLNDANIFGQRIDGGGALVWPSDFGDDGLLICGANGTQGTPDVSGDGAGGAWVTWGDDRDTSTQIYAQRVSGAGSTMWLADGRWINWGGGGPGIVYDGSGGAFIFWEEAATYPASVAVQRLNSSGAMQWVDYSVAGQGYNISGVLNGSGGLVLGWQRSYVGFFDNYILGQEVDGSGGLLWAGSTVSPGHACTMNAEIASDGAGGGLWAYTTGSSFVVQRMNTAGNPLWGANGVDPFPGLNPYDDGTTAVVSDGAGGALVVGLDDNGNIYVNRVDAGGSLSWGSTGVAVCDDPAAQYDPRIASDGQGGAYVVWQDERNYGSTGEDIYAEHVDGAGALLWGSDGTAVCTATGSQGGPQITRSGSSAIVAWTDPRNASNGLDIYAQALHIDGSIGDPPIRTTAIYPAPNAVGVPRGANIVVTFGSAAAPGTDWNSSFVVHGSQSGLISGSFTYDSVSRTATFDPATDFVPGEVVSVTLTSGIATASGHTLPPFAWSFAAGSGVSPPYFPFADDTALTAGLRALCAADLDGDGIDDLAVVNRETNELSLLFGIGDGTFSAPATLPTGQFPHDVTAADLNNDGNVDLVTTNATDATVTVFRNQGGRIFNVDYSYSTWTEPHNTVTGDFNGDGFLDLAISNYLTGVHQAGVSVRFNDGNGFFFGSYLHQTGEYCDHVEVGDMDGDGATDLICTDFAGSGWVLLNQGDGGFDPPMAFGTGYIRTFAVADLDDDGDLDFAGLADLSTLGQGSELRIFRGNGDGTFGVGYDAYPYAISGRSRCLTGDVNGDGNLDVIHGWGPGGIVWVGMNDGTGALTGLEAAAGIRQSGVAVADLDGDGTLDLASVDRVEGLLWINLNHTDLSAVDEATPVVTRLAPNVPNPFNPSTSIRYTLSRAGHVRLTIFDSRGHEVATLVDGEQDARAHTVVWDGRDGDGRPAASGVYFCRLKADGVEETRKMTLMK